MSEEKWDNVEKLIRVPQQPVTPPQALSHEQPLTVIEEQIDKARMQELDLIGRFKRSTITRRAALEGLAAMHQAQLERTKHALHRLLDVEKARIDTVANKYLFHINEEYLKYMNDLGIQNYESRFRTLLELNKTMARLLEQAQGQDVPPSVKETTIQSIVTKYHDFAKRIVEEELRLT